MVALSGHATYLYDGICISASASLIIIEIILKKMFKEGDKGNLVFDIVNVVIYWLFIC